MTTRESGKWYKTKAEARKRAAQRRGDGYKAYFRRYRWGKGRRGSDGKGELGYIVSWK